MIVDDEKAVTQLLSKYLREAEFGMCASVCDPSLAMEQVYDTEPDIILLDVQMKPLGGLELLELIRRDERTQHIPVIIVTSAADEETKITALNLGANDFLQETRRAQ